jgi:hypothetical protein
MLAGDVEPDSSTTWVLMSKSSVHCWFLLAANLPLPPTSIPVEQIKLTTKHRFLGAFVLSPYGIEVLLTLHKLRVMDEGIPEAAEAAEVPAQTKVYLEPTYWYFAQKLRLNALPSSTVFYCLLQEHLIVYIVSCIRIVSCLRLGIWPFSESLAGSEAEFAVINNPISL